MINLLHGFLILEYLCRIQESAYSQSTHWDNPQEH